MSYEEEIAFGVQQMLDADLQFPQEVHYSKKPVRTNADHIRAMTDEELAKFSAYQMSRGDCCGCPWFWPCDYEKETCTNFFLDWLKQPYGGDGK